MKIRCLDPRKRNQKSTAFPRSVGGRRAGIQGCGQSKVDVEGHLHSDFRCSESVLLRLRVKLLEVGARAPVVAHPGEDLGYDLFALEGVVLGPRATMRVRTGIAVEARHPETGVALGLLVRDRSSMAARGIATTAGVIDAGYRGEILVLMTNLGEAAVELKAGEKIAQMIPVPVLTGRVDEVESLEDSARAEKGFGSSGR